MMVPESIEPTKRGPRLFIGLALTALSVVLLASCGGGSNGPSLNMPSGPFHSGQTISISVGPNHVFTPYSHINVLECADPGGTTNNLPTSDMACDGNTIQGPTVLINTNGSFTLQGYELFSLPNSQQLGEGLENQPICNQTHYCVLYIGQNQNKFTAPKLFSRAFLISEPKKK
jgi:hypothetical protein